MSDTQQAPPSGSVVKDEPMTDRSHIDPDKHWIGESLPAASDQDTAATGYQTLAGTSPFPARANHAHEVRTIFGVFNSSSNQTIPPGFSYLNRLQPYAGRNMLAPASTQVILFPVPGIYSIYIEIAFNRNGGGYFLNEFEIAAMYFNGTYGRTMYRTSMFDIPSYMCAGAFEYAHFGNVDSTTNVQFRIANGDTASWDLRIEVIEITRVHGFVSA